MLHKTNDELYNFFCNNVDPMTNGEFFFYTQIKDSITRIFDIGCRFDSEFLNFTGEVHYFDPNDSFIKRLKEKPNHNDLSVFNSFGLGSVNEKKYYYNNVQSFHARLQSLPMISYDQKMLLEIKKGCDYMRENKINNIDFLKIDTEGYDFEVIKGFEEYIENVQIIQFEYGGTSLDDSGFKLNDIIAYLDQKGFHKFSYLHKNGSTKLEDLKGKEIMTNPDHRNGKWSSISYPEKVEYIQEDGFIPDHYNYCNIICINKNSNLQHLF